MTSPKVMFWTKSTKSQPNGWLNCQMNPHKSTLALRSQIESLALLVDRGLYDFRTKAGTELPDWSFCFRLSGGIGGSWLYLGFSWAWRKRLFFLVGLPEDWLLRSRSFKNLVFSVGFVSQSGSEHSVPGKMIFYGGCCAF